MGNSQASSDMKSSVQDPDISAISGVGLNDVCKYSITFIPTSDTLRFKYVFASEEYPEFSCGNVNDVFAFIAKCSTLTTINKNFITRPK